MPRCYKVPASVVVTAAGDITDLVQLTPAANKPLTLVGLRLGNTTEVGDAAEEGLELHLLHLAATVTDGGGTGSTIVLPVPQPRPGSQAAGFTARANSPTIATTTGTLTLVETIGWNNRATPLDLWYPETKWACQAVQGEALVLRLMTTLADDMLLQLTAFIEEDG